MLLLSMIFVSGFGANVRTTMAILLKEGIRIGLVALALEILVVSFAPHYRRQIFDEEFTGGFPLAVDASGQRGEVVPQRKLGDSYRILVLGDSISFGTGVSAESAWPAQLRRRLEQSGIKVECINAAAPGRGCVRICCTTRTNGNTISGSRVACCQQYMVALSLSRKI